MHHLPPSEYTSAVRDFRDARRRAALQDLLAWIRRKPGDLLAFEESKKLLKGEAAVYRGLKEIPLDAIIGSVGRFREFTRSFLPRSESDETRWARVKAGIHRVGFNPIEVYRIGEAYFVLDGNHRVSIARSRGDTTIQAYVTEIPTKVPLTPEDSPDDLILKAEQADFLHQTGLAASRPDTDFSITEPGSFTALSQRIRRMKARKPGLSWPDLAALWHDEDYMPFVRLIRRNGLRRDFPGRTEADLYAWIIRRQAELSERLGWEVAPEVAAQDLAEEESPRASRIAARLKNRLADLATPDPLEAGPRPGEWRQWALSTHRENHLFTDYLVPISGSQESWLALDQALLFAGMEQDYIHGLHIISSERAAASKRVETISAEFERRLAEAGVEGDFSVETGSTARAVCDSAVYADLVIMNIAHAPGSGPLKKLSSGLRTIIHRSPRPLVLVPRYKGRYEKLLLAFDGSPKAREALYISAYLAGKWGLDLTVLTVESPRVSEETLNEARAYLNGHKVKADYVLEIGDQGERILETARRVDCDAILMGGYGFSPVLEMVLGSAVDRVLRDAEVPVYLCR